MMYEFAICIRVVAIVALFFAALYLADELTKPAEGDHDDYLSG